MSVLKVERVKRTVIDRKLLAALSDSEQVAILATKQDLQDLHAALCGYVIADQNGNVLDWSAHKQRCRDLAKDLKQLMDVAFPA